MQIRHDNNYLTIDN